jgi:uncharacterized repeat protein (TIGR01451 family)
MKSFFCHLQSLDPTLTRCDAVSSQTIPAIWQQKRKTAISSWLGVGMSCVFVVTTIPRQAMADPAINAANFSPASGVISTTVPDGVCAVAAIVAGGGGGASAGGGGSGGGGGAGANIKAQFQVLPLQAVTGAVGAGGSGSVGNSSGGAGTASGGSGGTVGVSHRGAGGGGSSSISVGGLKLIEAGGGGGGGAAHQSSPVGEGSNAGFSGIASGTVVPGLNGQAGVDSPGTSGGGAGGQVATGGAGGSNSNSTGTIGSSTNYNGYPGGGIGSGIGGNGGADPANDSGGGGGGGYTSGGGGASTFNNSVSGGGGGGGSSYVRGTSPIALAPAPTNISGAAGIRSTGSSNGTTGAVTLDWIPCVYTLGITKKASAAAVKVGDKVIWTVTVVNNGSDPMTRGDTITLTDTLPTTGIGSTTPKFKVLSLATTGSSTDPNLDSGSITCTGVTVGQAMPASTVCSRPYSSASSPGVTASGTRGLNSGETLTITYEEIFANKTAAATITNTASTKDRSSVDSTTTPTNIIGVTTTRSASDSVTLQPYDLKVLKSVSSATIAPGSTLTWTVDVTNLGSADMEGPAETAANPLIVTDVAPTTNVSAPTNFTSTGLAGTCTYASGTITCPKGLPAGQTQTFTFKQTVNAGAPINATIPNTATVSDYVTGDSNDSSASTTSVSTMTASPANVLLVKRITAINGDRIKNPNDNTPLNTFVDNTNTTSDNDPNWPSNYLLGQFNAGKVKPGDKIEYSVYFMNATATDVKNLKICDPIIGSQTFSNNAYGGTGQDVKYKFGTDPEVSLSKDLDPTVDRAQLNNSTGAIPGCKASTLTGTNNGTVTIDITGSGSSIQNNPATLSGTTGPSTPNSYGYFRFTTQVN